MREETGSMTENSSMDTLICSASTSVSHQLQRFLFKPTCERNLRERGERNLKRTIYIHMQAHVLLSNVLKVCTAIMTTHTKSSNTLACEAERHIWTLASMMEVAGNLITTMPTFLFSISQENALSEVEVMTKDNIIYYHRIE